MNASLTSQELFLFLFAGVWALSVVLGWRFLIRPEQAKRRR